MSPLAITLNALGTFVMEAEIDLYLNYYTAFEVAIMSSLVRRRSHRCPPCCRGRILDLNLEILMRASIVTVRPIAIPGNVTRIIDILFGS